MTTIPPTSINTPLPPADASATAGSGATQRVSLDGGGLEGPELIQRHGTPQGQGYDEGRDQLLTTYYNDDGVVLSIQGRLDCTEETSVRLGGGGHAPPTKGGGVASDGEHVYVADGDKLYVYTRAEIDRASDPPPFGSNEARPLYVKDDIAAGSYVEVKDGKLYVGRFNTPEGGPFDSYQGEPRLYQYDVEDGVVADLPNYSVRTPYYVQDVAITDSGFLYSRSYSNKDYSPHYLTLQTADPLSEDGGAQPWDESTNVKEIPYYSEGISIIDGEVYVTHESYAYNENGDSSDTHVQRIPVDSLDELDGPLDPPEPGPWWTQLRFW